MRRFVLGLAAALSVAGAFNAAGALADGPGVGTPSIVAVGDSAISGEAGRWAGNTNGSSSSVSLPAINTAWVTRSASS